MFAIVRFMDSSTPKPRRTFTTRDILGLLVALVMGLLSLAAWRVFPEATVNPDVRNIVTAVFWFSFLGGAFYLGTVVWKDHFSQVVAPILVFMPSFLYTQTWYHLVLVIVAMLLAYLSIRFVHDEMEDRVRFRFARNVNAGAFLFVLALSLALSSVYFNSIQSKSWEELVPRFSIGEGTATLFIKTIAYVYPDWKKLADEGVTVDDFLMSLKKDEQGAPGISADTISTIDTADLPALAEYLKQNVPESENLNPSELSQELFLRSGREQIARLAGRSIAGDEKISDIFSSALQHKIIMILNGEQAAKHLTPESVPLILTVLFFLTLLPVASVVGYLWIGISFFFFRVAIFFGWVKLDTVNRVQDVLLS